MRVCMFELFQDLHKTKYQTQVGVERQEHQTGMQTDAYTRSSSLYVCLRNMDASAGLEKKIQGQFKWDGTEEF